MIVSLVRSNDRGEMGFVGDPNRVNVTVSRARHGMIFVGDIDFLTSDAVRNKSGQRLWRKLLSLLEAGGHVYRAGLPVVCRQHKICRDLPDPDAFDRETPEGGCCLPCAATLGCGHACPRR